MKKRSMLIMALAFVFATACNNKESRVDEKHAISATEVPAEVKNAFNAKYAAATDIVWEDAHEGDIKTYKVKFKTNDKYMKAEYKEDGSLVKEGADE
jgi:hypothetical protein